MIFTNHSHHLMSRLVCALGLMSLAVLAFAQTPALRLDDGRGQAQSPRVASLGPEQVIVGWVTPDAVYLRWRYQNHLAWNDTPLGFDPLGEDPRDLALTMGPDGEVHLVWTAVIDGQRRLVHAFSDRIGGALMPYIIGPDWSTLAEGDSDFPSILVGEDGRLLLVWQQSQSARYRVHAAMWGATTGWQDLGAISGRNQWGIAPQPIALSPLRVAWYEIGALGEHIRVDEWSAAEKRWRPSALEREAAAFNEFGPVLFSDSSEGLFGCWQSTGNGENATVAVGLKVRDSETQNLLIERYVDPPGDHGQPDLSGSMSGRLTLSWENYDDQGRPAICIVPVFVSEEPVRPLIVSPSEQTAASDPAHVTLTDWSAIVWTDDASDGGDGGIYFSEIDWE